MLNLLKCKFIKSKIVDGQIKNVNLFLHTQKEMLCATSKRAEQSSPKAGKQAGSGRFKKRRRFISHVLNIFALTFKLAKSFPSISKPKSWKDKTQNVKKSKVENVNLLKYENVNLLKSKIVDGQIKNVNLFLPHTKKKPHKSAAAEVNFRAR